MEKIDGTFQQIEKNIERTISAKHNKLKDWKMDPKGYFLIKLDNKVFLLLPSLFLIFTYSFFTDFEPRYGSLVTSTYLLIIIIHIKNIVYKQISYEK